jgi:beta-glucanase (GH16 family)
MINFKFLLGLYPSTAKIEAKENEILKEFERLESIRISDDLKRYNELKQFIESETFAQKQKEIKNLNYKTSEACQKENEYINLKKSKRIVTYYKIINHPLFANYKNLKDSESLKRYFELQKIINSSEFKAKQEELKNKTFKNSDLYKTELEYRQLSKSSLIKHYYRIIESDLYKNYLEINNSSLLQRYNELEKVVNSSEFKQKENTAKKSRFEDTPEYKHLGEYHKLKSNGDVKRYYHIIESQQYLAYRDFSNSSNFSYFQELEAYITSGDFEKTKNNKELFIGSEAEQKEKDYHRLLKEPDIANYKKFISSDDYKFLNSFLKLDLLQQIDKLEELINSTAFKQVQDYFKLSGEERWNQLEESKIEKEYIELKNDKRIIDYFKFINSKDFGLFQQATSSGIVDKYEQLKQKVESPEFKKEKEYLLLPYSEKWKQTEEFALEEEYKKLSSEQQIKDYLSFTATNDFKLYSEVVQTDEIAHFEELEKYIQSNEFKEYKEYMLLNFDQKWKKTEEYQKEVEFNQLKSKEDIIWYFKVKDLPKFDEVRKWQPTFTDDFNSSQIDKSRWLTRYYWGDNFLNDSYSLSDDKQFNTDGNNLRIDNSRLIIETRKEKVTGKAWNPSFGFMPKEFEYTSGLVNTGKSFRQQYGRFRAKIRMSSNPSVTSAFWMVGNQIIPHIDIAKYQNKKLFLNVFWGNLNDNNGVKQVGTGFSSSKLCKKPFIYEIQWSSDELVWYINGIEIYRTSEGVPHEPMYIQLSCGIYAEVKNNDFPATMEIDWIKCYQKAEATPASE